MVRENDHFSYGEGLGREGAWNSPISAQSFPKIEKGNIVNSTSGSRWRPATPTPLGVCAGSFLSILRVRTIFESRASGSFFGYCLG